MAETANTNQTEFEITGPQSIRAERVFNAPYDRVLRAYTDADEIAKWWGPRRFETVVDKFEPRAGGEWRLVHKGEAGEFGFHGVFHEVQTEAPGRIVQTFEFEGAPGHVSLETMTIEDLGGSTRVRATSVYPSPEALDETIKVGMEGGLRETYDRLAELVEA
ncbi:MAG: SRPBCC family protein [Solirubrobacterales bacterium]